MNITKNKVVSFDYTLRDKDDEVLDISGSTPLVYLHGYENIISGLEKAMEGKNPGDSFNVTIPAADAYGEWDESIVVTVPRSSFNGVEKLEEGMQFEAQFPNGSQIVKVIKVTDDEVTVDGNHPLSGIDLKFEVTIRDVRDATDEEIAHGHVHHEHGNCDSCDSCPGCNAEDDCHGNDGCGDNGCNADEGCHGDGCCGR